MGTVKILAHGRCLVVHVYGEVLVHRTAAHVFRTCLDAPYPDSSLRVHHSVQMVVGSVFNPVVFRIYASVGQAECGILYETVFLYGFHHLHAWHQSLLVVAYVAVEEFRSRAAYQACFFKKVAKFRTFQYNICIYLALALLQYEALLLPDACRVVGVYDFRIVGICGLDFDFCSPVVVHACRHVVACRHLQCRCKQE